MGLMEIADRFYSPKEWIANNAWFIRNKIKNSLEFKRTIKSIEKKYPKTFHKRTDWKLTVFEFKNAKADMKFHKKDLKKWVRVAKQRKIRLTKPMLSDIRKVMKLKEVM